MAYPLAEQKALQGQKVPHSNIDSYIALNDLKNLTIYGFDNSNASDGVISFEWLGLMFVLPSYTDAVLSLATLLD